MESAKDKASYLLSLGICLVVFGFLSSVTWFWLPDKSFRIIPSGSYTLIPFAALLAVSLVLAKFKFSQLSFKPEAFAWTIVLVFFSDWMCKSYSYFKAPTIRGELLLGSLITFFLLRYKAIRILRILPPLAIVLLISSFLIESQGRMIFSDDHATFFYRLTLLKENFPSIPFYYPFWNGGIDARAFFATGSLNLFFLSSPFLYLFPLEDIFNYLILGILFLLVPGATYLAAKLEHFSAEEAAIAALLSLSTGFLWYRWALSFGTMGFIVSTALVPLNLVLALKIISRTEQINALEAALFIVTFTLMLFWSLSGIVFIPLIIAALFSLPALFKKKFVATITVSLLILNLPWIGLFWSASNVSRFLVSESKTTRVEAAAPQTQENKYLSPEEVGEQGTYDKFLKQRFKHRAGSLDLKKAVELLRENAYRSNPLLVFLGLPGLFLIRKRSRVLLLVTSCWLLLLGTLLVPFKPQLELDRMMVILAFFLPLPTALVVRQIFSSSCQTIRPFWSIIPALLIGGYLLTGPLASGALVRNRGPAHYTFLSEDTEKLISRLQHIKGEGRILFTGCLLHELNGGHLAPLTHFTGKALMASSPVHNLWRYTQAIPAEYYGKGLPGVEEYFELYNVTHLVVYEGYLKKFFRDHPEYYQLVWENDFFWPGGALQLYRRRKASESYFLKGDGTLLEQDSNGITVALSAPEAILKFNYFPFLTSSSCSLAEERISDSVSLIKLSQCVPGEPIRINSVSPWKRLGL